MQIYNSSKGYGAIPQVAHWLTVILVPVAWILGLFGDDLPKGAPRAAGLFIHISAGLVVVALLVVRQPWNLTNPPPGAEPTGLGEWADRLG
jgi:cytochrome b561